MSYEDRTLTCQDCGTGFTFTAEDQQYHAEKCSHGGLTSPRSRGRTPICLGEVYPASARVRKGRGVRCSTDWGRGFPHPASYLLSTQDRFCPQWPLCYPGDCSAPDGRRCRKQEERYQCILRTRHRVAGRISIS